MMQQAQDLLDEGKELKALLETLSDEDWQTPTPFKNWTVNDVMQHLHSGDQMAVLSLTDPERFEAVKRDRSLLPEAMKQQKEGQALFTAWWDYLVEMSQLLGESDPKRRVPWFGPDMGVKMFTTARQMETWAHAHDIYDLKRQTRQYSDRIRNIAEIGVRTYGWTFVNRKLEPPGPMPYVKLTAPSGAIWEWGEPSQTEYISGSAVEFCHVVTQGRNIQDVSLEVHGEVATQWMAIAQCFAGPPEQPPAPGSREA
ncbi:MAG: TIGR03084 family metal-binding protein [Pseudomonadota bacterium]